MIRKLRPIWNDLESSGLFMCKKKISGFKLHPGWTVILLFLASSFAFAQQPTANEEPFFSSGILQVYFLMLLFATIINRILEYFKLLLAAADRKIKFFYRIGNFVWHKVRRSMDGLGIFYDEQTAKKKLQKYMIFAVMQFWGFVLGVGFALELQLNALSRLNVAVSDVFGYIITGLVIGAGIEPVHSFFRIAQEKRKIKELLSKIND